MMSLILSAEALNHKFSFIALKNVSVVTETSLVNSVMSSASVLEVQVSI